MANVAISNLTTTWNNVSTTFTGIKLNVTDTASAAASNLLDLQVGGTSKFKVNKSGVLTLNSGAGNGGITADSSYRGTFLFDHNGNTAITSTGYLQIRAGAFFGFSANATFPETTADTCLFRDAANTLAQRNGTNAQESRIYASYTSATNFQRTNIKTAREVSTALSGASYTTTIAIPAYANLIGVTTRVTTAVTGATSYDVGDGTDVDLWGAAIDVALGSQSATANFTAVGAVGAAATSRTIKLTANGSNFTGGVVEICAHYIFTEAD